MTQPSNFYTLLTLIQSTISNLGLTDWNNNAVPVLLRKIPKSLESGDPLPQIVVGPGPKEKIVPWDTLNRVDVTYFIDIVTIVAGNQTNVQYLDYILHWREQIRGAIEEADFTTSVSEAWYVFVELDPPLDRAIENANYDYSALRAYIRVRESS